MTETAILLAHVEGSDGSVTQGPYVSRSRGPCLLLVVEVAQQALQLAQARDVERVEVDAVRDRNFHFGVPGGALWRRGAERPS